MPKRNEKRNFKPTNNLQRSTGYSILKYNRHELKIRWKGVKFG